MLNHSSRETTLEFPRTNFRRDEYEMIKPRKSIVTRDNDLEDVAVELEMRIVGSDF
jgi:hypothetical protein